MKIIMPMRSQSKSGRSSYSGTQPWREGKDADRKDRSTDRPYPALSGKQVITADNPVTTPVLTEVIADAYTRLIAPAIEREIRNELTEKAEDGAITVFGKNLEQLLMQPPIAGRVVLGWDPAFRTGCKLAVVDETGKVLDTTVIFPTEPQNKVKESKEILKKLIKNITYP